MAEVLVLVDHVDGEVKKVTLELLTAARALGEPSAVVVGTPGTTAKLAEGLAAHGAEKINEPRYPSFKGIMAAKKKPVNSLGIADLGLDASEVGLAGSLVQVDSFAPRPPKSGGQKVEDEGDGGAKIAEFLVGQKLI